MISENLPEIERLKQLMRTLRDPQGGCPWDIQQNFETIAPHTIEEAYEVVEAIENKDYQHLKEELGDLLFQVIFYCQMAEEQNYFTFDEVVNTLVSKMIFRHPHVFSDIQLTSGNEVEQQWEDLKKIERQRKAEARGALDAVPSILDDLTSTLPALTYAFKLQKKAAKVGFDFATVSDAFDKVEEEVKEAKQELQGDQLNEDALSDELGDILFAVTNVIRKSGKRPEELLRRTNMKFKKRFQHIENAARQKGQNIENLSLEEMETHWIDAKNR